MSRILVVEDEQHLADGLRFNLEAEDYEVEVVDTGEAAVEALLSRPREFDILVLDVMLPGMDGFSVMRSLRLEKQFIPTLMLTARGRSEDVLQGFEAGADDYLPKPFDLSILLARIRGLLRRSEWNAGKVETQAAPTASDIYEFAGRVIDFDNLTLHVADERMQLTLMEANLLRQLIRNEGNVVSRRTMLEEVWGLHEDTDTRAIDNFIVRLRKYIEPEPSRPLHLLTVRGVGYRFVAKPK